MLHDPLFLDMSSIFRKKWHLSPKLSRGGEDIGAFVYCINLIKSIQHQYDGCLFVLLQEQKPFLRLHHENRFYERSEEELLKNYLFQKNIFELWLQYFGYVYSADFSLLSRELLFILYKVFPNAVFYTMDEEFVKTVGIPNCYFFESSGTTYVKKNYVQLSVEGFPFFLEGVDGVKFGSLAKHIPYESLKNLEDFWLAVSEAAIAKSTREKIFVQKNKIENNYKVMTHVPDEGVWKAYFVYEKKQESEKINKFFKEHSMEEYLIL